MDTLDVLVIGAGPTGLTLACDLARQGIAFRIVDQADSPPQGSRGYTLKPQTLAGFDDLGVAERITAVAAIERGPRFHLGRERLFDLRPDPVPPTTTRPYPNAVGIPQWRTEALQRERLGELGGKVEHGQRLTALDVSPGGVTATLDGVQTVRARFLVGADGGRSTVRKELGIGFPGVSSQDARAILADVRVDGLDRSAGVHLWLAPESMIAARPIEHTDLWLVTGRLPAGRDATLETLQELVTEQTGRRDLRLHDPVWLSAWKYNLRLADSYRSGPVFLAGDAAHVHPPFGGHGMNTGVQDAHNLGWKLGLVIRGVASEALLDTYELERRPGGEAIRADSERQKTGVLGTGVLASRFARPFLAMALKAYFARNRKHARDDHPVYPPGPLIGEGGGGPGPGGRTPPGARRVGVVRG